MAVSRRKRRILGIAALLLLVALVGGGLYGCESTKNWAMWGIVCAPNYQKTISPADDPGLDELKKLDVDRQLRVEVGPPSASLSVWIVEPKAGPAGASGEPRGTILLLHGIHGNKRHMLGMSQTLAEDGFRCVLIDLRGHGRSSGDWFTYGVQESKDLSQVLDSLAGRRLLAGRVGVYGTSYGGSTALMLAGRDERVEAVATVAAFSTMREVVAHNIRRYLVLGFLLTDGWCNDVIDRAGKLAGFNPDDADPRAAAARTRARLLIIHGKADPKIPYAEAEALHAASRNHSRVILLDGEDHDSIMFDRSGTLSREVPAWFEQSTP